MTTAAPKIGQSPERLALLRAQARSQRSRADRMACELARLLSPARPCRNGPATVKQLLRCGGVDDPGLVAATFAPHRYGALGGVFDHGRMFAHKRRAVALVGFPYGLVEGDRLALDDLRALGLVVVVQGPASSLYGFGTHQVFALDPQFAPLVLSRLEASQSAA